MSMRQRLFGVAMVAAVIGSIALAAPAHAAPYDGTDPISTGCAPGAITARSAYGKLGGVNRVLVELRYSPRCRTAWARVTTQNMPNCITNADYCGGAIVHRNSDGLEYSCYTPNGTHGCYTRQVNDAGVTSYAYGWADYGAWTAYATTGSY